MTDRSLWGFGVFGGALIVAPVLLDVAGHAGVLALQLAALFAGLLWVGRRVRAEAAGVAAASAAMQQAHARLRDEVAAGRSLLDAAPIGVLMLSPDGHILSVNPMLRRMLHLEGPLRIGEPLSALRAPQVASAVAALQSGRAADEIPCVVGDLEVVLRPVRMADGGLMLLAQDVTRFRKAERARTEFVGNVSHELRTPVASILGYSETLLAERARLAPDLLPLVLAIERNGRRLRDLFEDLIQLSRVEARAQQLPLVRVLLRPLLERAVADAADQAFQRRQTFSVHCKRHLEAWVNAEALAAIVSNLVRNAVAYTPDGGHVSLRVIRGEGDLRIEVTDDGIGIDPVHHERIFERFYRIDPGRSRDVGGTGLGLAIVKHLALASGCKVGLRSRRGEGSTFIVTLPSGPVETAPPPSPPPPPRLA